jgi:HlyD family secretion protein
VGNSNALQFQTAAAQRGDLTVTVTATGTLEPVNQVEVGSELSGTVETVAVDYNEQVKRGQILARLDTEELEAKVVQGRAALKAAEAKIEQAQATVLETRLHYARCQTLIQKQLCTQEDAAHKPKKAAPGRKSRLRGRRSQSMKPS